MKKLLLTYISVVSAVPVFADGITDGLSLSGDHVYAYTSVMQALGFVIAAIIGIAGAYSVYLAYISNSPDMQKKVLTWGCSCLAMLSMTIALPQFFDYQESGLGGNGSTLGGVSGDGSYAGGDKYGQLDPSIPDMDDSRWITDGNYIPITVGEHSTSVSYYLNDVYNQMGGGQPGTFGRTIEYISQLYDNGSINDNDYSNLMRYVGNLPHC